MATPSFLSDSQGERVDSVIGSTGGAYYKAAIGSNSAGGNGPTAGQLIGTHHPSVATAATDPFVAVMGTIWGAVGSNTAPIATNAAGHLIVEGFAGGVAMPVSASALPVALGAGGGLKVDGSGTALPVDTELPAAVALANGDAIPTAPTVGSVMRQPFASAPTQLYAPQVYNVGGAIGGSNYALLVQGPPYLSNNEGSSSVARGNTNPSTGLLASAARTATATTADQSLTNGRGVILYLNVTANPGGAETLSLKIQAKDQQSGAYTDIADAGVVITAANGARILIAYPGVVQADHAGAGVTVWAKSVHVPFVWRAVVTHSAAGSWTYSMSQGDLA